MDAAALDLAPYNQEFIIFERATNQEVARCHWFLGPDKKTPAASSLPDPKEINWQGENFHQLKKHQECAHCKAGISTYPTIQNI
jgi:hypothetical protein